MADSTRINPSKLVFGLAVVAAGILFTLHNLSLIDASRYFIYWPVVLIAIGLVKLGTDGRRQGLFAMAMIGLGAWILLYNLEITDLEPWIFFWPVVLVLVGTNLVLGALRRPSEAAVETQDMINHFTIWSGLERHVSTQSFQGGDLNAIMGGCDIDLSNARISEGTPTLHVFAFWGGIDVKVPREWKIDFRVMPLLGAASDETAHPDSAQAPTLVVKGMAIMGGIGIQN